MKNLQQDLVEIGPFKASELSQKMVFSYNPEKYLLWEHPLLPAVSNLLLKTSKR